MNGSFLAVSLLRLYTIPGYEPGKTVHCKGDKKNASETFLRDSLKGRPRG